MIGIVILNYKNYTVTLRCVDSIFKNPPSEDFQVIIVDNGSQNESAHVLKEKYSSYSNVVVHELFENRGFAAGNNYGIDLCEKMGVIECILTNSDIIFCPNSIDNLIGVVRQRKDAVIVGPKIIAGSTLSVQQSSRLQKIRFIDVIEIGRFFPQKKLDEVNESGIRKVHSVSGCCFAINIRNFRNMGAFDTNTFLYNEENIMGIQAEKKGLSVYIDLDTQVIHEHGASSGKDNDFVRSEYIKSTLYYWKIYRKKSMLMLYFILLIFILKLATTKRKTVNSNNVFRTAKEYLKNMRCKVC